MPDSLPPSSRARWVRRCLTTSQRYDLGSRGTSPGDNKDWLRAVDFLHALDALDQLHGHGNLTHTAYARRLEEQHRDVSPSVWMTAAHLVHLTHRIMTARGDDRGDRT